MDDIEELRAWLNTQKGNWPSIAKATGYPYFSLQKFAQGQTKEPRLQRIRSLEAYRKVA